MQRASAAGEGRHRRCRPEGADSAIASPVNRPFRPAGASVRCCTPQPRDVVVRCCQWGKPRAPFARQWNRLIRADGFMQMGLWNRGIRTAELPERTIRTARLPKRACYAGRREARVHVARAGIRTIRTAKRGYRAIRTPKRGQRAIRTPKRGYRAIRTAPGPRGCTICTVSTFYCMKCTDSSTFRRMPSHMGPCSAGHRAKRACGRGCASEMRGSRIVSAGEDVASAR